MIRRKSTLKYDIVKVNREEIVVNTARERFGKVLLSNGND
jgi:hypothetical protein